MGDRRESCLHSKFRAMPGFSAAVASENYCEISGKRLFRPYIVKDGVNADGSHYCTFGELECDSCKNYVDKIVNEEKKK